MAKEFFDYDPINGVSMDFDYDADTDTVSITRTQDVTAAIDFATAARNEGRYDGEIKKDDYLCFYAVIPAAVQMEMFTKYGIKAWLDEYNRAVFDCINKHYPYLKVTNYTHAIARDGH